ncbi:MAG: hypothetical protein AAF849_13445 [Bacteroidota bacterium]
MNNEILDYQQPAKSQSQKYTHIAFGFALINLGLLLLSLLQSPRLESTEDIFYLSFFTRFIFIVVFSCAVGISAAAMSFIRKERNSFLKWFALLINLLFFLLLFVIIYYVKSLAAQTI